MADPRIEEYIKAVKEMAREKFEVSIPTGEGDDLDGLGLALTELAGKLGNRFSTLNALLGVMGKITSGLKLDQVLDHIYESFTAIIPYDRIGCAMVDAKGKILKTVWARSEAEQLEIAPGYAAALKGSSLELVLDSGKPRILNDLEAYLREHPESDSTKRIVKEGVRSSLTCPMIVANRPIGLLFFSSSKPDTYKDAHVEVYSEIASQVSLTVDRGRLYQQFVGTQSQLVEVALQLEEMAKQDSLTGVPNRRLFDEFLEREWWRAMRLYEPLSVILIDIDHFKEYNDKYGHLAGDSCLKLVAEALTKGAKRGTDLIARFGGEEFVVLLGHTNDSDAARLAEQLRDRIAALDIPHERSPVAKHVTISLGVVGGLPRKDRTPADMINEADRALYKAKQSGRNRVVHLLW